MIRCLAGYLRATDLVALGLFMLVLVLGVSCVRPPPWGEASGLGHPKHWNQTG